MNITPFYTESINNNVIFVAKEQPYVYILYSDIYII